MLWEESLKKRGDDYVRKMNLEEAKNKMAKSVETLSQQLRGVRGSKVSPNLISSIRVMYNGQLVLLDHLASAVLVKNQIAVTLFDSSMSKSDSGLMGRIEKSISAAGFTAYVFSKDTVIVSVPVYTQREEISSHIRKMGEVARVAIRNIRKKAKKSGVPEKDIQRITDEAITAVDEVIARVL
jgi:ribosome recycling factor